MQIPVKRQHDPRTELLIATRARIADAGPERFDLSWFVTSTSYDYATPGDIRDDQQDTTPPLADLTIDVDDLFMVASRHEQWGDPDVQYSPADDEVNGARFVPAITLLNDSLKYGTCGRVACLAGHGAMAHWERTGKLVTYQRAMEIMGLDDRTCGSYVDSNHPFHTEYEALVNAGTESNVAEWVVTLLALNQAIDVGMKGQSYRDFLNDQDRAHRDALIAASAPEPEAVVESW